MVAAQTLIDFPTTRGSFAAGVMKISSTQGNILVTTNHFIIVMKEKESSVPTSLKPDAGSSRQVRKPSVIVGSSFPPRHHSARLNFIEIGETEPCPDTHVYSFVSGMECCSEAFSALDENLPLEFTLTKEHCPDESRMICEGLPGKTCERIQPSEYIHQFLA